jgi:alpha-beta hydrolase superfamily lysophospholipase
MRTWPLHPSKEREEVYAEFGLNKETIETFGGHPVENLPEYFSLKIPTLLVAGDADEVVPYEANSKKMIDYCEAEGIPLTYFVKPECLHHPHSLEDVSPIIKFVEE